MFEFFNDSEFLDWREANPTGFVVNARRPKADAQYFVLHSASCSSLGLNRGYREGAYTERSYQKLAVLRVEDFRPFMRREGIGDFSKVCSRCSPNL